VNRNYLFHACVAMMTITCLAWIDPLGDHVKSGNAKYEEEEYSGAESEYKQAAEYAEGEDRHKLHLNQGDAAFRQKKFGSALKHYQEASRSESADIQKKAYLNMGNTYLKQKKADKAADSYIQALKVDPGYMPAKQNLEYLIQQDENQGNRGKEGQSRDSDNDKKDGNDQDKNNRQQNSGQQGQQKDSKSKEQASRGQKKEEALTPGQVEKLMEMMRQKPVRKPGNRGEKGVESGKNW